MKQRIVIAMMLTAVAARGWTRDSVEFLYPPGHSSTSMDRMHLVGRADTDSVALSLNGLPAGQIAVVDSTFHALIWLPYGLNKIGVSTVSGEAAGDTLEVLCGPRISQDLGRLYLDHAFHGSEPRDHCLGCHAREETQAAAEDEADWCYGCHGVIRERFQRHLADTANSCIGCHQVKADLTYRSKGIYSDMNPCFLCHKDKIGEFAQDFIHGPVAGGVCTVCHDPHGSRYEDSLQSPVPLLCLSCHSYFDQEEFKFEHQPFTAGQCTRCHDPHATNNRWVLIQNSQTVCTQCHFEEGKMVDHSHPFNVKPRQAHKYDLRLTKEGRLECLSCHNPHRGNTAHLLRTENEVTCAGCHGDQY